MVTEQMYFLSADQKTSIHAVIWRPDSGKGRAVLQITHGMEEYIERYRGFAEYLTKKGFIVAGHDHLGHGNSVISEADLGYFGAHDPSGLLVADLHTFRKMVRKKYPKLPYFMLGHSMGSYILRKYLAVCAEDSPDGAILVGTGYLPQTVTSFGIGVVRALEVLFGSRHRSRLVKNLTYNRYYRRYDLKGKFHNRSWLTKDEEIVKAYYSDPKCAFTFTLNGYLGLFDTVRFACQRKHVAEVKKDLPLLFLSGADDPVGDFGKGVRHVCRMFMREGCTNVFCKLYKNDRHEILNETDREMVYRDIFRWIRRQGL